jgi:preprotein translocase subunit SecG
MGSLNFKSGSKKKELTIIVALIAVIVILNAIILVVYLLKEDNTNTQANTQSNENVGSSTKPENTVGLDTITGQNRNSDTKNQDNERTYSRPESSSGIPGIYPQASERLITYGDIKGMHVWDIIVMRNEIYARYGHIFTQSWELRDYFNSQPWYRPISTSVENQLTPLEKRNVQFLLEYTPKFDMNNIRGSNTYVK